MIQFTEYETPHGKILEAKNPDAASTVHSEALDTAGKRKVQALALLDAAYRILDDQEALESLDELMDHLGDDLPVNDLVRDDGILGVGA